ncbi:MAG: hypothetical protein ACJAXJ_001619 [Colwellia sp.]|jgi:hypothetical protein
MMARSTATKTTKLHIQMKKAFKDIFVNPYVSLGNMVESALKSVNDDIYSISLTPHMNNRWSVFMMFGTSEKVIDVNLDCVKADIPAFIEDVKRSGLLFVERYNEDIKAKSTQDTNDIIGDWVVLDLSKLNRKIKRVKNSVSPEELINLKGSERILRRELWDLEEDIKKHFGCTTIDNALLKYQVKFPLGVEAALAFGNEQA